MPEIPAMRPPVRSNRPPLRPMRMPPASDAKGVKSFMNESSENYFVGGFVLRFSSPGRSLPSALARPVANR
jgi:hypothetical protein